MPKIEVHLWRIDFIKKKKGMLFDWFTDFWFFMLKIPGVYNKDGAQQSQNFRHFRHFSSL